MSGILVDTKLPGYEKMALGPIASEELLMLDHLYDQTEWLSAFFLDRMGKNTGSLLSSKRYKTEDGYNWFWGLQFLRDGNEMIMLFPWRQDWDRKDALQLDRSIAIYHQRGVTENAVTELIAIIKLHMALLRIKHEEKTSCIKHDKKKGCFV